jgi:hypothetical protein
VAAHYQRDNKIMSKTKTKDKKIIVIPIKKRKAETESTNVIAALMDLQVNPGWAIIVKNINDNIAFLEQAILEKRDPVTKIDLSDAEVETLRIKRSLNIDIRDTPANYIKVVQETEEVPEDFDPYFKTNEEIIKAKNKTNED